VIKPKYQGLEVDISPYKLNSEIPRTWLPS